MSGPWHFDAEKYLAGLAPSPPMTEDERKYFRALFEAAHQPIDRGKMWRIAAEKSGMTLEELFFSMNRTNEFIGSAPFYGGDAEGLAEFMALKSP